MRLLTFAGILHDDGKFELEPGFVVEGDLQKQEGELEVVAVDHGNRPLKTTHLILETPCAIPGETLGARMTARSAFGLIAFPAEASGLQVVHHGKVILQRQAPSSPTTFKVDWPTIRSIGKEIQKVKWRASAEGCRAALGYSNDGGATWTPVSIPSPEMEIPVDMNMLPGGDDCLFELIASDGLVTTRLRSSHFVVALRGWLLWILSPVPNTRFDSEAEISLVAQGYHLEKHAPGFEGIQWTSSKDGSLGNGAQVRTALTSGAHTITAKMHDIEAQVTITVGGEPPRAL